MKTLLHLSICIALLIVGITKVDAKNYNQYGMPMPDAMSSRSVSGSGNLGIASHNNAQMLTIDHKYGNITFEQSDNDVMTYSAQIKTWANTQKNADILNSAVDIKFEDNPHFGGALKTVFNEKQIAEMKDGGGQGISYEINLVVKMPKATHVRLNASRVQVFSNMPIKSFFAEIEGGSIDIKHITEKIDLITTYCQVKLDQVDGNLGVESRNSTVEINTVKGAVGINARYGNVTIKEALDAAISVLYGNLTIEKIDELKIGELSYGACTIGSIANTLVLENIKYSALKAHLTTTIKFVDINASYTDVALTIDQSDMPVISFELVTSFAPINAELDGFTGISNGELVSGTVGDCTGKKEWPRINVHNRYGAITLLSKQATNLNKHSVN